MLLLIVSTFFLTSCGTLNGRMDGVFTPEVYPGTRVDINFISQGSGGCMGGFIPLLGYVDFPFSVIIDTVLLPGDFTYWAMERNSTTSTTNEVQNFSPK